MPYKSVRYRKQLEARGSVTEALPLVEAVDKIKTLAEVTSNRSYKNGKTRKDLDQTVEVVMHLGIDPRQADQLVRGSLTLPHGIGKSKKVVAFCDGELAEEAKAAGAVEAGVDELVDKISKGWMDFDVAVAHPSVMGKIAKLGRLLGPQGKMPSPKAGTVTPEVATAVKEYSAGKLEYRNDAGGNIHLPVGKVSFTTEILQENIEVAVGHIQKVKPAAAKGAYMKRICLSATRTPSVTVTMG
ncbi:MAG: 50S ribosomal protein L1 [Phycisphaerae bacterium]|nr:50S ribosomal protein L1 [Phycisphaerae bacterium]